MREDLESLGIFLRMRDVTESTSRTSSGWDMVSAERVE